MGNFAPHRDSIPGPSSPHPVAIPTELSRPAVFDIKSAIDSVFPEPQNGGYPRGHINCESLKPTLLPEMLGLRMKTIQSFEKEVTVTYQKT